jgi:hypothetical protein
MALLFFLISILLSFVFLKVSNWKIQPSVPVAVETIPHPQIHPLQATKHYGSGHVPQPPTSHLPTRMLHPKNKQQHFDLEKTQKLLSAEKTRDLRTKAAGGYAQGTKYYSEQDRTNDRARKIREELQNLRQINHG